MVINISPNFFVFILGKRLEKKVLLLVIVRAIKDCALGEDGNEDDDVSEQRGAAEKKGRRFSQHRRGKGQLSLAARETSSMH